MEDLRRRKPVYKKRKRSHKRGLLAATAAVVLAVLIGVVWYINSSPGFYLVPLNKEGSAMTIWAIDEDGPIGCPVIKKQQWGKSRMYQKFSGAYLVDDTYVIYASDEYTEAYNQYHNTDYICFVLEETPQGSFRFKGSHSSLYPYNSAFMDCYWEEYSDEGGGIYYKNAATGHRLSVWGESVFKAQRR